MNEFWFSAFILISFVLVFLLLQLKRNVDEPGLEELEPGGSGSSEGSVSLSDGSVAGVFGREVF